MGTIKKKSIIIGIDIKEGNDAYINLISRIFDIEKVYSFKELIKRMYHVDMLIYTGGDDVHPSYYNDKAGSYTFVNTERDKLEFKIANIYSNVFKLGICRGAQLLTVSNGGRLIQHVTGHNKTHNISLKNKSVLDITSNIIDNYYDDPTGTFEFPMTSSHHQMMYPYSIKNHEYEIIAWSTHFLSDIYLSGSDKNIKLESDFLEPEIVYYKNKNSLCIQGHPEYSTCNEDTVNLITKLILNYIN